MNDAQQALLARASSPDQPVREEALKALAAPNLHGSAEVVAVLLAALRFQEDAPRAYRVRQLAAEALAVVGDSSAVQALTFALEDEHSAVRAAAAAALGKIGDAAGVNALTAALKDTSPEVRQQVIVALSAIDAAQTEAFVPLLADPEDGVRTAARTAILAQGDAALPALVEALRSPNSTVRGAAAELLGTLKDERARAALDYTAKEDKSEWVKGRAKWALGQLPPPLFTPPQIKRGVAPPPPSDTLKRLREQAPELPTLQRLRGEAPPPAAPPAPPAEEPQTVEAIQALLDQLDVRLAKGEISEATYQRLVERWEARLNTLR